MNSFFSFHITGYGCKECIQNEENNGLKSDIKQIVNEVSKIFKQNFLFYE
jgi:hypothetical protein